MRCKGAGLLVVLLLLPALHAEDKDKSDGKDKKGGVAAQYEALVKEYQKAQSDWQKAISAAKATEERRKIVLEKNPDRTFAEKFVAFAEKNRKDALAVDALLRAMRGSGSGQTGEKAPRARAVKLLLADHLHNEKVGEVCSSLTFGIDAEGDTLLKALAEKSKKKETRARACLALAQRLGTQADFIPQLKEDDATRKQLEGIFGKDAVAKFVKRDAKGLRPRAESSSTGSSATISPT